jgi:hypothetical protein
MAPQNGMNLDEHFDISVSRPLARRMARPLADRGFTADQVSVLAMGFGVAAGVAFTGGGLWPVLGGLLLVAMVVLDCTDGEVARLLPPSDKPWRGRQLDGLADLATVLSVHIGMGVVLTRTDLSLGSYALGGWEVTLLLLLGFVSFSWKSSVLDDIKQRLKPKSVDHDLSRYATQDKTLFEQLLYGLLVNYVRIAERVTGQGRPGGYDVFRLVALVGPSHHLVAIAACAMLSVFLPKIYLTYLLLTIGPGNLFLWVILHRARRREATA